MSPTESSGAARPVGHVRLDLSDTGSQGVASDLSAVAQVGRSLWLATDETPTLERVLTDDFADYDRHESYPLADFFDLPGGAGQEADLEGLAFDAGSDHLWLVGSHSLRRGKPKGGASGKEALKALKDVDRQANRFLLGRIRLDGALDLSPGLAAGSPPEPRRKKGRALPFDARSSALTDLLAGNPLLGPFLDLPSKDNGLDIEGLAVKDGIVMLGLRGPVLRGWATILQLRPEPAGPGALALGPVKDNGRTHLHHVLDLGGLGIRDLCAWGDDLLILAGPTMVLDGPVQVFRWSDAFKARNDLCVDDRHLRLVLDLPWGHRVDHAEGMTLLTAPGRDPQLLVVYDSPAKSRLHGNRSYTADLFPL